MSSGMSWKDVLIDILFSPVFSTKPKQKSHDEIVKEIQDRYRSYIEVGWWDDIKKLKESTGIDPSERVIQAGYNYHARWRDYEKIKKLYELTGTEPEFVHALYRNLAEKGGLDAVAWVEKQTGVKYRAPNISNTAHIPSPSSHNTTTGYCDECGASYSLSELEDGVCDDCRDEAESAASSSESSGGDNSDDDESDSEDEQDPIGGFLGYIFGVHYSNKTGTRSGRTDDKGNVFDGNGNPAGHIENDHYYDKSGRYSGKIEKGVVYDRNGNRAGYVKDNVHYDQNGNRVGWTK